MYSISGDLSGQPSQAYDPPAAAGSFLQYLYYYRNIVGVYVHNTPPWAMVSAPPGSDTHNAQSDKAVVMLYYSPLCLQYMTKTNLQSF